MCVNRAKSVSIEEYILQDWAFEDTSDDDAFELATVIAKWARSGNWLDLGCGPMLGVWPLFACGPTKIWGCDIQPEIANFYSELRTKQNRNWPRGLLLAQAFVNRKFPTRQPHQSLEVSLENVIDLVTADVLEEQPSWHSLFDTVIQIGCFGCLKSKPDLERALSLVVSYLRPTGRFISATWNPRASYKESERWGGNSLADIHVDEFVCAITNGGLIVLDERVCVLDDAQYQWRYIIVAEKPG